MGDENIVGSAEKTIAELAEAIKLAQQLPNDANEEQVLEALQAAKKHLLRAISYTHDRTDPLVHQDLPVEPYDGILGEEF